MRAEWRLMPACAGLCAIPCAALAQSQATATKQPPAGAAVPPNALTTMTLPDATQASGASGASGVEEIVVTAQRRSERLQNVPVAVSAASAARLEAAGVSSTQELAILTPGLSAPQTAGFAQPHIRGVGSSTAGAGLEQPVATYIDGVYIAAAPAS